MEEQKMESSMSRYSIVERITRMKLDIMDNINALDINVINKEQELKEAELNYQDWQSNVKQEQDRQDKAFKRDITSIKSNLEIVKKRKAEVVTHYQDKIKELDKALLAIQEISKTAPSPQEQN
jgi:predicted nuclease with TOPRIM domain